MKKNLILKRILMIALILVVIVLSAMAIWINLSLKDVRNLDITLDNCTQNSCYIIDDENVVKEVYNQKSNPISLSDLNEDTVNAFLAIEDKEFFKHNGVNVKRIVKSTLDNIFAKKIVAGGSTITQQLIKNKFLTNEQTLKRKVQEIYLARKLESKYSKEKILESYLNEIYYGNGAYGIENASIRFFSKSASELTLSESCILAGVINSPSTYSPLNNIENSKYRRDLILREMKEDDLITEEEYNNAVNTEIVLTPNNLSTNNMDMYDLFAINEAAEILGINVDEVYKKGYKIYTGKNTKTQQGLDKIIEDESYYQKNSYGNIADSLSMVIDNESNMISAISGKSDYNLINLERQPGSLIKPILVYAPALEEGLITPATQIYDEKINYNGYSPQNVGGRLSGYISVKDAVAESLNIPAVKVCNMVGLDKCKLYAEKCGLTFDEKDLGYSLALGGTTNGFTLQTVLDSYSPLIYNGFYRKSNCVKSIKDIDNMTIYNSNMTENKVFNADTAYLMTNILQYSTKTGTSKKLSDLQYDIAGKTGTVGVSGTNLNTDVYSLGYTTQHRVAVWLGNYSMDEEYHLEGSNNGGTFATEMLKNIFKNLYSDSPPNDFIVPDSVIECDIDTIKLDEEHKVYIADENLPDRYKIEELFSIRYLPEKSTSYYNSDCKIVAREEDDKVVLSFNTNKYSQYKLFRKSSNEIILLSSYKNKDEKIIYIDDDIISGNKYTYFLECYNTITKENYESNKESIYILKLDSPTITEKEINNTDTYSWLFA